MSVDRPGKWLDPRSHRRRASLLLLIATTLCAANARATSPADSARAEALFREGKSLMTADQFEAACPKLAESQQIEPGSGTLLALAICNERQGHAASALANFKDLVELAGKEGHPERQDIARARIAVLAPTVAHITLSIPPQDLELDGLSVTRDAAPVSRSHFTEAWAVDPGDYQVSVSAPDHVTWSMHVTIAPAQQQDLDVPVLDPITHVSTTQRTLSFVTIGVGAASIVTGVVFGAFAIGDHNSAQSQCANAPLEGCSNLSAVNENDTARSFATASTIFIVAGVGATAIGAALFWTAPRSNANAQSSAISAVGVSVAGNRFAVVGTF